MSDRFNALTVVLDRDIRDADAEPLLNAIRMLKGVQSVTPRVADLGDHLAKERARREIEERLWKALRDE